MRASCFSPATRLALFNASSVATLAARRSFASNARLDANYGFVGLGQMGFPMAKNLRAKINESDTLYIHDVNQEATKRFQNEVEGRSVVVAKSAREVAENSETVITVLPEPSHVKGVYKEMLQPATLLTDASITEERLFIDCSTIDPRTSAEVADAAHSSKQGKFVDAPMSGGVVGATAGKLTFMLGAPEDLVSRVEGILGHMGARVVHLGPQTSGLKGKLANNYLLALNNVATAEAMNMGVKWGLDATKLADMINTATGRCWPSEVNNPVAGISPNAPASRDYKGGFGTALMLKDLKLALQAATEHEIVPLLGTYAAQIYTAVQADKNCENRDFSVVYRWLEQRKHQR